MSRNEILCYANGDIVFTGAFGRAVDAVSQKFQKFLAVSKRINIDIREPIVSGTDWESRLFSDVKARGMMASTGKRLGLRRTQTIQPTPRS